MVQYISANGKLAKKVGQATAAGYRERVSDFHLIESKLKPLGFAREEWETYSHGRRRIPRKHPEDPVWVGRGCGGS